MFWKYALQLYWNHTFAWVSPANLLHIFRTPFTKNTLDGCFWKSSKMMLNQIWTTPTWLPLEYSLSTWHSHHVFILDYLLGYLELCLYWENWKIDYLVWSMLSFQKKLRTGLLGLKHVAFFITLIVNDNMFNKVAEVVCRLLVRNSEMDYLV